MKIISFIISALVLKQTNGITKKMNIGGEMIDVDEDAPLPVPINYNQEFEEDEKNLAEAVQELQSAQRNTGKGSL